MRSEPRSLTTSILVIALLLGMLAVSVWTVVSSEVFAEPATVLGAGGTGSVELAADSLAQQETVKISGAFQVSQPRDPFRPLITPDSPIGGLPGVGGEPGTGTDGDGFTPTRATVTLVEIREVDGVLRATVDVNGETFEVGVGDTFAGSYKVVSLESDRGVFTFGDKAFELSVGQQILK